MTVSAKHAGKRLSTRVYVQVLSAYLKYMTDIGVLLGGADSDRSVIMERMREVIAFEHSIAKVICILCALLATRTW